MDPSKSSAPPVDYTGAMSAMEQMPPPAHPGYSPPGPGYPPHPQGFRPAPPPYGVEGYGYQPYPSAQPYPSGQPYPSHQPYSAGQPYQAQPTTITAQPTVYVTRGPQAQHVNDYIGYSIFTLLCCCLPLGIVALIFSISARDANNLGDYVSAARNSRMAKRLNHVGLGFGLTIFILTIVYFVVVATAIRY